MKVSKRIVSLLLLFIPLYSGSNTLCAQWLEGYNHRLSISVDKSLVPEGESLSDFPLLFSFTDTIIRSTDYGGYVHFADGMDFCFADKDSMTVLDFEIESYEPESGSLSAWIRIPSISAEDNTELFLYFGNPDGLPLWDTAGVWSNQYTAVWHMADDPSDDEPQLTDATSLMNHGTTGGDMSEDNLVEGKISGGIQFDGVDDYAIMPVGGFNTEAGTVELWINLDSMPESSSDYFFAHRQEEPITDRVYLRVWPDGEWGTGMGDTYDLIRGDTLDTGSWHHLAIAWGGAEVYGFLDGTQNFGPIPYSTLDTIREIYVMTWMPDSESASGTLDELRVSGIDRDSAWIAASYLNQHQPDSCYQVQSQFVNDSPCSAIPLDITDSCIFSIHSNLGAGDSGIPDPGCGEYEGGDIWFSVIVPETGSFEIQTDTEASGKYPHNDGWMFRAAMAIYTGSCEAPVLLDCNKNNSTYHPRMAGATVTGQTPGDTIWVRIWESSNDDNGLLKICVTGQDLCPPEYQVSFDAVSITCKDMNDGSITSTITGGAAPYLTVWSGSGGFSSTQPHISNLPPGTYTLTVTDTNQCVKVGPDILITEPDLLMVSLEQITHLSNYDANDGAIDISVSGGTTPYTALWSGTDDYTSSDQDPSGMTVGYYEVMVTDEHFCRDSMKMIAVSLQEDQQEVFIPEGFSPNGDGFNDLFVILGIENHPENELVVFNRQGVEIFHRVNYENDWDGRPETGGVLGGILSEGTYYYVFKYGTTSVKKGFVYLNKE